MIDIKKEGIILRKTHLDFENEGVLNPAVIRDGDHVHVYYRAVARGNYSSIGYCRLDGPLSVSERWNRPFIVAESAFESHGVEDPRLVRIDKQYYLTYTGYDGTNARGALATSRSLKHFSKKGIIVPTITYAAFVHLVESAGKVDSNYYHNHKFYYQEADPEKKIMLWDKNLMFFPRKINGKLVFLHRIRPGIQLVSVNNLKELNREYWEAYFLNLEQHIVMDPVYRHESSYIGGGCPPIETDAGWLMIYHGVSESDKGLIYTACAALLDLKNPLKEIARLPYPLFVPKYEWETKGEVNNVVFPTGTAIFGNTLFIYYGAADTQIACASVSLPGLIKELLQYKGSHEI